MHTTPSGRSRQTVVRKVRGACETVAPPPHPLPGMERRGGSGVGRMSVGRPGGPKSAALPRAPRWPLGRCVDFAGGGGGMYAEWYGTRPSSGDWIGACERLTEVGGMRRREPRDSLEGRGTSLPATAVYVCKYCP